MAKPKVYDIEAFLADVRQFLVDNLASEITALNAEKNDGFSIIAPHQDALFLQTLNNEANNFPVSIVYGVDDVQATGDGSAVRRAYSVYVVVVMSDGGNSADVPKKLFRYQRVLEDLFNRNWATMKSSMKIKVRSLVPVSFQLADSSDEFRAIGVGLDFTLAR